MTESQRSFGMTGKVVIVTGGTEGIGRAIAEAFLEEGAHVVVCARKPPTELPRANSPQNNIAEFIAADVRELDQIDVVVAHTVERFGRLDVLVNNAGGSPYVPAAEASERFSEAIIRLNLLAPLLFSQRANAVMQTQPSGGAIVHITSVSGTRASPGTAAYGAAKAGLINLAKSQAVEWAPKVRVNCVTAGLVETPKSLGHYGDPATLAEVAKTVPMGRMGTPTDVANACLFLSSALAGYVSGTHLVVDGAGQWPAFLVAAQAAKH
jgi:NAD(P)-dependent dehydrogenase (short-subunit alcohol dehydrogenase family)